MQRAGDDDSAYALLLPSIHQALLPMIRKESLQTLLRKCERPSNIRLQAILKVFPRLLQKRLLARMLDTVYCQLQLQTFEALVCFDVCERLL